MIPPRSDDSLGRTRPARLAVAERFVEVLLLAMVGLCIALLLSGLGLAVARGERLPHDVVAMPEIMARVAQGEPAAYLSLGLLVLLATPALRVVGALLLFALERDGRYVLVAGAVLAVMGLGALLGWA